MNEEKFWQCIAQIDTTALVEGEGYDEIAVEPLVDALAQLSETDLQKFQSILAQKLYDLDGREYANAAGEAGNSNDGFLYLRCYVVASGRREYEKVLANPLEIPKTTDAWCESLLFAVEQTWEERTVEEWDYSPQVSYETGSNRSKW